MKTNLRPGDYVLLGGNVRVVSSIIQHPAGAVVRWIGGETASLAGVVAAGGKKQPRPLRDPGNLIELVS